MSDPVVGVLLSRVRVEEKLLLEAFERRGIRTKLIDDREVVFKLEERPDLGVDVVLERCIQHSRALYALAVLETHGVPTVNTFEVADICGNKLLTTTRLIRDGVPSPRTRLAFTPESALAAVEELGYPAVLKPLVGSWGRLISKVNDRDAAESVLEHKDVLLLQHVVVERAGLPPGRRRVPSLPAAAIPEPRTGSWRPASALPSGPG